MAASRGKMKFGNTVESGIGNNARSKWSGNKTTPTQEQQLLGFYVGQVMDDQDEQRMGRVWVYIHEVSTPRFDENSSPIYGGSTPDKSTLVSLTYDQRLRNGWLLVSPMMPYAGSDDYRNSARSDGSSSISGSVNSYGSWNQPRIGDFVGVMFSNGDPNNGYWIGMIPKQNRNGMIPGNPGVSAKDVSQSDKGEYLTEVTPDASLPARDKALSPDENDPRGEARLTDPDLTRNIIRSGLANDTARGAGTSGARRESPSYVSGMKSGGWSYDSEKYNKDVDGGQFQNRVNEMYGVNTSGHSFVMDDHPDHQAMRMRTSSGSQITMHDAGSNPFIYIQTASGNTWIELSDSGDISIYAQGGIHVHSEGDYNLTVDGDMNIGVKGDYNLGVTGDYNLGVHGFAQQAFQDSVIIGVKGEYDFTNGASARVTYGSQLDMRVGGDTTISVVGNVNTTSSGAMRYQSQGDYEIESAGDCLLSTIDEISLSSGSSFNLLVDGANIQTTAAINLKAGEGVNLQGGGDISIKGGGNFNVDGATINMNSGMSVDAGGASPSSIGEFFYADSAAPPVLPNPHQTSSAPSGDNIMKNEAPTLENSVAPVVPQHQPWSGRAGFGDTGGTNGLVNPSPIPGGLLPRSSNTTCSRTEVKANIRTGAGSLLSLIPNAIMGGFEQTLGQLPTFGASFPFSGTAQGETPEYFSTRLSSQGDTHKPESLDISKHIKRFIKSSSTFNNVPKPNSTFSHYLIGFGTKVNVGDIIGGKLIDTKTLSKITSFGNDIEKSFSISLKEAEDALDNELKKVDDWVSSKFKDIEFTQSQFDSLISFVHHVGIPKLEKLKEGKQFIDSVIAGNMGSAQELMYKFSNVGGGVHCSVLDRRRYEASRFGQPRDRDGIANANRSYDPTGKIYHIAGFKITEPVFNAIINAQKNLAPQLPDGYLMTIAAQESGFDPNAEAEIGSAAGLFQFIIDTGARYGLSKSRDPSSNVFDPVANSNAAARFNMHNYNILLNSGVSNPNATDLYMAHFLGAGDSRALLGATKFLKELAANPGGIPAHNSAFRKSAAHNNNIFYKKGRVPRTYAEIYQLMNDKIERRRKYFTGLEDGVPPSAGIDGTGLITWVPGVRAPYWSAPSEYQSNQNQIRALVETSASEAGLEKLGFNSAYRVHPTRDPQYINNTQGWPVNDEVGGAKNSQHTWGRAIDIHIGNIPNSTRRNFIERLIINGATGLGVGTNTLHVDNRPGSKATWKYDGGNAWCRDILRSYGFHGA